MITLLVVGKIKENFLKEGVSEYKKRISHFDKINIIEIDEEGESPANIVSESKNILNVIPSNSYSIALDMRGKQMSSVAFAEKISNVYATNKTHLCFIIGGSRGLSSDLIDNVNLVVSFSEMTFPHQLFRLILLEQIYRAFKINSNQVYHK